MDTLTCKKKCCVLKVEEYKHNYFNKRNIKKKSKAGVFILINI